MEIRAYIVLALFILAIVAMIESRLSIGGIVGVLITFGVIALLVFSSQSYGNRSHYFSRLRRKISKTSKGDRGIGLPPGGNGGSGGNG